MKALYAIVIHVRDTRQRLLVSAIKRVAATAGAVAAVSSELLHCRQASRAGSGYALALALVKLPPILAFNRITAHA